MDDQPGSGLFLLPRLTGVIMVAVSVFTNGYDEAGYDE
jgi:hypothetical protein